MNVRDARRWAAVVGVVVAVGGCASGAWEQVGVLNPFNELPPSTRAHRAVERVTMRFGNREFDFVGYRTCDRDHRNVRVQLLLDSGISVLDVAVHDGENERISGSAFEAIPRFADIAMEDLRRVWGSRSAFRGKRHGGYAAGGNIYENVVEVSDGTRNLPARDVDAGWVAFEPRSGNRVAPLHVTLLDADLVPEATIDYADFDEHGVPREIRLVDLRDGHTLDVEVEEVRVAGATGEETTEP